jgi:hypothetical protein
VDPFVQTKKAVSYDVYHRSAPRLTPVGQAGRNSPGRTRPRIHDGRGKVCRVS